MASGDSSVSPIGEPGTLVDTNSNTRCHSTLTFNVSLLRAAAIASPASISSIGSQCPTLAPRVPSALQAASENPGIVTHKEWVVPPRPKVCLSAEHR
jgi:hypothetical protein